MIMLGPLLIIVVLGVLVLVGLLIAGTVFFAARSSRNHMPMPSRETRPVPRPPQSQIDEKEQKRILAMVADGKIKPEEAEKLLDSLGNKPQTGKCPYCAEKIPAGAVDCPECKTPLTRPLTRSESGRSHSATTGFSALGGASKTLILYQFVIVGIILLSGLAGPSVTIVPAALLALLGLASAILMCMGNKVGWILGIIWSALQIVVIYVNYVPLNRQFFYVGIHFLTNGCGIGFNFVGIALLIVYYCSRQDWLELGHNQLSECEYYQY